MTARLLPFTPRVTVPDRTDPAFGAAWEYLRPRKHLYHVSEEILAAFLAGARHERTLRFARGGPRQEEATDDAR